MWLVASSLYVRWANLQVIITANSNCCNADWGLHLATSEMWCWSGGRGILKKYCLYVTVLCTIIMVYEQFLLVGRLYRALILLGLALYLLTASVSLVFMVLYIYIYIYNNFFAYILVFPFHWAEPCGIGPWHGWLITALQCVTPLVGSRDP